MKMFIINLLFILFINSCLGQCNSFLESRNGFRNIKLGASVKDYPEFILKNEANKDLFKLSMNFKTTHVYTGKESDKINTAGILFIYLITEDNIIKEIRIVTQKVLSAYSTLESAYGEPTDEHGAKLTWRGKNIECTIEGDDTAIPGYHIRYKSIPDDRKIIYERMEKAAKEAQGQL